MKIVYFDYWTGGIQNFVPLDAELRKQGHATMLLHIGSFNDAQKKEEVVQGIHCRDISFYGTKLIYKMLECEKPDVLITLNTTKIPDRVIIASCRKMKIKSIYLMHGIRALGSSNDQLVALMEQSYNSFVKKIKKAGKYFSTVIPNYVYALSKYAPANILNLRFLRVVYSYFKNPGKAFYFPEYRDELLCDTCLVYSISEGNYYESFGYRPQQIKVVGNPKNDVLNDMIENNRFAVEMLPQKVNALVRSGKRYALYLEESFPEQNNMGGYTVELRNRFILECAERLKKEQLTLVVKLHPTTREETITVQHDNLLIEKTHLDVLIYYSECCICSLSTAINNCVLMKKPVLMPLWGGPKSLPMFFIDAGVSNRWEHKDDAMNLAIDAQARDMYISTYITVVTPDAVKNILHAILN